MGIQEQQSRKRTKRKNLQFYILRTVAAAGVIAVGAVAPNVLGALGKLGFILPKRQGEFIKSAQRKLVENGYLVLSQGRLSLTKKGERALLLKEGFAKAKPRKWDGKWRILVFDIPERRKSLREKVRNTLLDLGFYRLQDSVWVYPYECEDFITLLKTDFRISKELLYVIGDSIENDSHLIHHFSLKRK
ncbi:MAG TPA: CRISPR-associated endonuclease Cas2 [Candidatus Paceibacterota bacterium]|jgi:CRISPR-associated endonuclease Cas2|nr:CRISPR-associated endonuclease Cas2 [Candidatus Paceibacterota bacterium]